MSTRDRRDALAAIEAAGYPLNRAAPGSTDCTPICQRSDAYVQGFAAELERQAATRADAEAVAARKMRHDAATRYLPEGDPRREGITKMLDRTEANRRKP